MSITRYGVSTLGGDVAKFSVGLVVSSIEIERIPTPNAAGNVVVVTGSVVLLEIDGSVAGDVDAATAVVGGVARPVLVVHALKTAAIATTPIRPVALMARQRRPGCTATRSNLLPVLRRSDAPRSRPQQAQAAGSPVRNAST